MNDDGVLSFVGHCLDVVVGSVKNGLLELAILMPVTLILAPLVAYAYNWAVTPLEGQSVGVMTAWGVLFLLFLFVRILKGRV